MGCLFFLPNLDQVLGLWDHLQLLPMFLPYKLPEMSVCILSCRHPFCSQVFPTPLNKQKPCQGCSGLHVAKSNGRLFLPFVLLDLPAAFTWLIVLSLEHVYAGPSDLRARPTFLSIGAHTLGDVVHS